MSLLYEKAIRPILFSQDPERAHHLAIDLLQFLCRIPFLPKILENCNLIQNDRPLKLFGLTFPNPVGLAAGMDKNAQFTQAMAALGFGFTEIGTVTHKAQPGNSKPRLFRYPKQNALINRMGFNNEGAEAIRNRLQEIPRKNRRIPIGINIGKSKVIPIKNALDDYLGSFRLLADQADYFTINVSSPNTPSLRELQEKDRLEELLQKIQKANQERAQKLGCQEIPILLKIAPDLTYRQIDEIIEIVLNEKIAGLIATNTTVERPESLKEAEMGGLSGSPLHQKSLDIVKYIAHSTNRKLPIIGTGGVDDATTAARFLDVGASLVQLYSGLVYRGPFVAKIIAKGLKKRNAKF